MEVSAFIELAVLEVLLVAAIYVAFLHFRKLKRAGISGESAPGSQLAADQYAALLQELILQADARLAGLEGDDSASTELRRLIEFRLAVLKAERTAADSAGPDDDKRWDLLAESLSPLLPAQASEDKKESKLVESLRLQITGYEKRLANLEKFRELFFDMKARLSDSHARTDQLQVEVSRAVPEDEQSPELKKLLSELESENRQLNEQLEHVEDVFTNILKQTSEPVAAVEEGIAGAVSGIDRDVERIRSIISSQEKRIGELSTLIEEKEMALADKQEVERALEELRESGKEMESVIEVIEEENSFLQQQISMLLQQELEKDTALEQQVGELSKQLEEARAEHANLTDKFAVMEKEYLQMYEENRELKDAGN